MVDSESAQFTQAQVQQMSEIMLNGVTTQVLPSLMNELTEFCTGKLLPEVKAELMGVAERIMLETTKQIRESMQRRKFSKADAQKFMNENYEIFNKHEETRDDAFWKATRYYELEKLYQQGLNEVPIFVPRNFRRDRHHVMCENELKILQQREENDLRAEIEVCKLREEKNRKRIELQDDLVTIFVNDRVENPYLKEEILRAWNKKNKDEMERVNSVWKSKIEGVKKGFAKDKEYIKRHNMNRVKNQNNEPSRRVLDSRRNRSANSETLPISMESVSRSNNNETRGNGVSSSERNHLEEVEETEVSPSDDSTPEDANATEDLNEGNEEVIGIDIDSPTERTT